MPIDVAVAREKDRRRRLRRLVILLAPLVVWLWWRLLTGNPVRPGFPQLPPEAVFWLPGILLILLLGIVFLGPMLGNGRSPHTIYLPEQIEVGFDDVKGIGAVVGEVRHTLEVFLNHNRFRSEMGGNPRRGVLFEGPPGTGKTHIAKAMAKEAGVPFLFVSSTAFQSMWYGATARKIRTYFRQLRKVARREGGAIGFIEEIDAIGIKRGGMSAMTPWQQEVAGGMDVAPSGISQGIGGVVNELLIQMQSFDEPTRTMRLRNAVVRLINRYLPSHRHFKTSRAPFANILLIGATNRADSLDPALLRPGRFDRILHFGLPSRRDRRELIDYFLDKKVHSAELDRDDSRDTLAATTMGYTPAALERLFDEALLNALRAGRGALSHRDVRKAQMEVEIGLPNPVDYPADERETIATHESGHAVAAYLVGKGRRLEVLSIIKRRDSLGLLAHRDEEERYTKRASEMKAMLQISFGGMVAEEIFYGESGTGPAGDLATATKLAVDMVGSFGLGDSLISFRSLDRGVMGGNLVAKVLADGRSRKTVDRILNDAKHETTRLLTDHRHLVEALRDELLVREELVEDEILDVLRAAEAAAQQTDRVLVDLRHPGPRLVSNDATRIELLED
jgi:ATP-dependent Zn protease